MNTIFDDEFDALQQAIAASGKTVKDVATHLFPHLRGESAYARLKACINADRDERLTMSQVVLLMRYTGQYQPLHFMCDETFHARPDRKTPGDEVVKLSEVIDGATSTLNAALKRLAAIQEAQAASAPAMRVVGR